MELTFSKTACPCLRKVVCKMQTQEQTQEVRLPDAMPDIGRVLGSWGQVLIRSKEWRGTGMAVSGGVMTWVLYAPEDGAQPRSMEAWIPFQMRWEFPQTERDGTICVVPLLKSVDARSTSARKLMVRANVSLLGEALEPVEPELYIPENVPEDVQLLKVAYPMELHREAGEKLFQLDEELTMPNTYPAVEKILHYEVLPKVLEQKVMAGRLIFRGKCSLHMLFSGDDGMLHSWDTEVPFSQYTELDRDYGPNSSAMIQPMLTNLELNMDEQQRLQLKCAMGAQYVICDRVMAELIEDAYSPVRQIKADIQMLEMPIRLDQQKEILGLNMQLNAQAERIVDVCCLADHAQHRQNGDLAELAVPGQFQVLYYDNGGNLQSGTVRGEGSWTIPSDSQNRVDAYVQMTDWPQAMPSAQSVELMAQCEVTADVFAEQGIPMVTGITVGELAEPDPGRPSLILRRMGKARLWDIARECGSTVEAIRKANHLQEEPETEQLLLIPVL